MPHHCPHADAERREPCGGCGYRAASRTYSRRHDARRRWLRSPADERLRRGSGHDLEEDRLADQTVLESRRRPATRFLPPGGSARDESRSERERRCRRLVAAPGEREQVLPAAEHAGRKPVAGGTLRR